MGDYSVRKCEKSWFFFQEKPFLAFGHTRLEKVVFDILRYLIIWLCLCRVTSIWVMNYCLTFNRITLSNSYQLQRRSNDFRR